MSLTRDVERPIGIDLDQDQGNSVVSTLCLGNEFQITYAAQEKTLNVFHMRSLRKLLGWSGHQTQLCWCGLPTLFKMILQRWLRWLVWSIKDRRIPKTFSTESLLLENALNFVPIYATGTCANGAWSNLNVVHSNRLKSIIYLNLIPHPTLKFIYTIFLLFFAI